MAKLACKPVSMLVGAEGGLLADAIFKKTWRLAAKEDEAPKATGASRRWHEILCRCQSEDQQCQGEGRPAGAAESEDAQEILDPTAPVNAPISGQQAEPAGPWFRRLFRAGLSVLVRG